MYEDNMPVFIKIENYKEVIELIGLIKGKVSESKKYLDRIESLKREEDSKINDWKEVVKDIEDKIDFVNMTLMEPKL
ncbi:MAG: hypothetical protein KAQ83_01090 [Nanoarchaeota archaeon]|nr:hypothetical protein [Nanoarchaeota archaeon]